MVDELVSRPSSEDARGFRVFATLANRGLKLFAKLFKKAAPKIAKSLADREALDQPASA
uniref:Peu 2e n=1 Tax=Peucetia striata TaxID=2066576 RepID=A0A8D7ZUU3_9ARAC|nr:Peu 2e precursor [Peucetia striata]